MRVEGSGYSFDFTHVRTSSAASKRPCACSRRDADELPPIHLASGQATTLGDLAQMANAAGGGRSRIDQVDNHAFNVSCFVGDPKRAREVLGWRAEVPLAAGVRQLVAGFPRGPGWRGRDRRSGRLNGSGTEVASEAA